MQQKFLLPLPTYLERFTGAEYFGPFVRPRTDFTLRGLDESRHLFPKSRVVFEDDGICRLVHCPVVYLVAQTQVENVDCVKDLYLWKCSSDSIPQPRVFFLSLFIYFIFYFWQFLFPYRIYNVKRLTALAWHQVELSKEISETAAVCLFVCTGNNSEPNRLLITKFLSPHDSPETTRKRSLKPRGKISNAITVQSDQTKYVRTN